jgi:hypothetical protein
LQHTILYTRTMQRTTCSKQHPTDAVKTCRTQQCDIQPKNVPHAAAACDSHRAVCQRLPLHLSANSHSRNESTQSGIGSFSTTLLQCGVGNAHLSGHNGLQCERHVSAVGITWQRNTTCCILHVFCNRHLEAPRAHQEARGGALAAAHDGRRARRPNE